MALQESRTLVREISLTQGGGMMGVCLEFCGGR